MAIHADASFFGVKKITARSSGTRSAPLQLRMEGVDGSDTADIIIFTDDQQLTDRLIAAINGAFLPSFEEARKDPAKARVLFDASKGGNVRGITEDHRFELAKVFAGEVA